MEWVQEPPAPSGNLLCPEGMIMVKSGHETVDANPQTLIYSQLGDHWQRQWGCLDFQLYEFWVEDRMDLL